MIKTLIEDVAKISRRESEFFLIIRLKESIFAKFDRQTINFTKIPIRKKVNSKYFRRYSDESKEVLSKLVFEPTSKISKSIFSTNVFV